MHTVLAARSSFSIGEGILTVEELVEQSKAAGATAIALTDTMTITGMIDFTNRAKKADIKPILGCRLRISTNVAWRKTKDDKKAPPEYYLTVYVVSELGLKALFRLLTLANSADRFYNTPKLEIEDVYEELDNLTAGDIIITSGDVNALTAHPIAEGVLAAIASRLGEAGVYLTVSPINTPYYDTLNIKAVKLAEKLDLQLLVTRPVLYAETAPDAANEADAADVMNAVTRGVKMSENWVQSPAFRDLHPQSMQQWITQVKAMQARLAARGTVVGPALAQGLRNTIGLANRIGYIWSKAPVSLPKMADDEFATLVAAARAGWSQRLSKPAFGHQPTRDELVTIYKPRLEYELSVLKKLGFAGYFLLVMDIVNYAKSNGILVGPGRGSVGGSLVAYLVGITDCDPIRFDLLFERFINPDRIDLPDADLDFMSARRGEIIDYLVTKYGQARVAGISNFGKLAAASAIRNVGKAFGLNEFDYACSKFAPKEHGANVKLPKAAEIAPEIGAFRDKYTPIWDVMVRLEGVMNIMGRHAAGVVVGGCDLVERGVIERRKDGATMNWDKRIVEDQGLVKVDILGLETLDLIDLSVKFIRERTGRHVDLMQIPLDDKLVLDAFAAGKTTGIFQFESGGMRRLLKELGKDGVITFDDITAATALYRPGPMESGMMDSYWKRKQGQESVDYDHPLLEEPLKPTYGVFVYQEQVMRASVVMAGYSGADADKLRKIMGKKLPEEMAKERGKFVNGCVATVGITPDEAGDLFDKIEGFAGYGFNKSHSVEYTLISYQAMWLKVNYPVEFYAAALSLMKEEKLASILKDANAFGVKVVMPDINNSSARFEILNDTCLAIPFNRIKGISDKASVAIMKAREGGKFKDKADFVSRVERRTCNKRVVDALEAVGAFARIEPGQVPAHDPSRIMAQRELIPGLIVDTVPINRDMANDKFTKAKLGQIVGGYRQALGNDGQGVAPVMGKNARFMVIFDGPSSGEERQGAFTWGDNFRWVADAMSEHGLERSDGYWTGLIKRPKEGKQVSPKEIELYGPYLDKEIDLLKPPLIVLLGSMTVRNFFPDFKGKASDSAGKIIYSKRYDANFVIGFNPGEIYHDPDKQLALNDVFAVVAGFLE
jgi:DNA polymerase-3 subunit alpha